MSGRRAKARAALAFMLPGVLLVGAAGADAAEGDVRPHPDLVLPRDGLRRDGDRVEVRVENRGEAASPATVLELADRPLLGGPTGTSCAYRPLEGEEGIWIDAEPLGRDSVRVVVHLRRPPDRRARSRVRIELDGAEVGAVGCFPRPDAPGEWGRTGSTVAGSFQEWDLDIPAEGLTITLDALAWGRPPTLRLEVQEGPSTVHTARGPPGEGRVEIPLDVRERPAAVIARLDVPPLRPGESIDVEGELPGGRPGEIFAHVDPDDLVPEIREGNNVTSRRADDAEWTLGALHVHSCLSEGPGSFDWQAYHAALSGYDLVWWTEHDWRVTCFEHLERFGFEGRGDGVVLSRERPEDGGEPRLDVALPFSGEQALALASGERVRVRSRRDRFAYSLASDVTVRLAARLGDSESRLRVHFELSKHRGEWRRLVYELQPADPARPDRPRYESGAAIVPVPVPTGGWKEVELPLSRDAARLWPNGLDDNLLSIAFELVDGSGAQVDDVRIRHERCGRALQSVQEEWARHYPNLRHEIGGEISYRRPHLTRYGGGPQLVDLDEQWDTQSRAGEDEAEIVIRRVRDAGGVSSWCHPYGPAREERFPGLFGERYWEHVIDLRLGTADLLEVGYRDRAGYALPDYLDRWDRTTAAGIVVTGVGVNDSHHVQWGRGENNFGTWIAAPADDVRGLLEALRAGRVFFGDPLEFRGRLGITCGDAGPGEIVTGEGPREVRVRWTGAPDGTVIRILADGKPLLEAPPAPEGEITAELSPGQARWVRAEARGPAGTPLAFTNPVYFDPAGELHRPSESAR